ncbi:MAG TPA: ABC-2 transporter permease, partial [Candidatus Merdivicinus excrementipullorum]|nr:ABC-2 transporter permease [Candidatus Merdivicinus excrementipullorum]HIZ54809.1 ABC-2 transporter permease [Bacillota bacterium]
VFFQLFQLLFSIPFVFLRNTMNIANNPVGLDATVAWYGFGFILYAVFDLVFLTAFYKSGYKVGKSFIFAAIPMAFLMVAIEATAHIPALAWMDSYQPAYIRMQVLILIAGVICFTVFMVLAYQISVKRFTNVDM